MTKPPESVMRFTERLTYWGDAYRTSSGVLLDVPPDVREDLGVSDTYRAVTLTALGTSVWRLVPSPASH